MFTNLPLACATCQLNTAGGGDATGWSILFLLVLILMILGGIMTCMFRIIRRGSHIEPEFCDDYIRPTGH